MPTACAARADSPLRRLILSTAIQWLLARPIAGRCLWSNLQGGTDTYLDIQTSGIFDPSFANVTYRENNVVMPVTAGIMTTTKLAADSRRTIYDQEACATYTELISASTTPQWVLGVQLRFTERAAGTGAGGIDPVAVDIIATTTGDWLFNASRSLEIVSAEDWSTIPADKRDTRDTLRAAADAYLDLWGQDPAAVAAAAAKVPWGTPCRRMEGSAYTGNGSATDSCAVGIPQGSYPPNSDRRYVIDETVGAVSVLCKFETMRGAPDSHEFRLESGKLRYVHTITVMRNLTAAAAPSSGPTEGEQKQE